MKSDTMSAFWAVVWKELRENWYWAAGFSLLVTFVLVKNLRSECVFIILESSQNIWNSNWSVLSIAIPAFGLAIGLRQILSEKQGDRWAFLLHRPVSRVVIFLGKAAAAIGLLTVAVGLPLVCTGIWLSVPGNYPAPWDWALIFPYCTLVLSAIGTYMTAVYAGTRRARWFGSRGLSIVGAAAVALSIGSIFETWTAFAIAAVFAVISTIAARGSFVSNGTFGRTNRLSQASQMIIVLMGLSLFGRILHFVVNKVFARDTTSESQLETQNVYLDGDGRLAISHSLSSRVVLYETDLSGRKIRSNGSLNPNFVSPQGWSRWMGLPPYLPAYTRVFPITETYNDPQVDPQGDRMLVYYDSATNVISAYEANSHKSVGSITETGRQAYQKPIEPAPEQVFGTGHDYVDILTAKQLTSIDIEMGVPTVLYSADPGETLRSVSCISDLNKDFEWVIVGSKGLVVKISGRKPFHIAYFPTREEVDTLVIYRAPTGNIIVSHRLGGQTGPEIYDTFSAEGKFVSSETVPELAPAVGPFHFDQRAVLIANAASPLAQALLTAEGEARDAKSLIRQGTAPEFESARVAALNAALPYSAWFSLLCILPAWFYGRRAGLSKIAKVGWAIAMVPLGWGGLLLMVSMIGLPATEECTNCGKQRAVNEELCRHCGARWPVPATDGTEIFDTAHTDGLSIVGASSGRMEQNR